MQWEYRTIKIGTHGFAGGKLDEGAFTSHLNDLGSQGWELITAFDTNQAYWATRDVVAIFKRPRG